MHAWRRCVVADDWAPSQAGADARFFATTKFAITWVKDKFVWRCHPDYILNLKSSYCGLILVLDPGNGQTQNCQRKCANFAASAVFEPFLYRCSFFL